MANTKTSNLKTKNDARISFNNFIRERIEILKKQRRFGTASNYRRTLSSFDEFLKHKEITFKALTPQIIERYNDYLISHMLKKNSISFYMRNLRALYNKAVRLGFTVQKNPFRDVYTGIDKTRHRAVSETILKKVMMLNVSHCPTLQLTQDIFLFSFFTRGMSFIDLAFLRPGNIVENTIIYNRRKTGKDMAVKIEPCIRKILNRYLNKEKDPEYIFPIIKGDNPEQQYKSYQTNIRQYNYRLKTISEMIGLKPALTSYTSRHSWATMAQKNNIPLPVISAGMGHNSEATTRIYLKSLENKDIDNANQRLLKKFNLSVSN